MSRQTVSNLERARRISDAAWLKSQIEALAQSAVDNAKEDREEADTERDARRATALIRAADTADHYAKQLLTIASGMTPQEALAERLLRAAHKPFKL